jgi:hypothetical protein
VGLAMREFDRRLAVVHDPWTLFLDVIVAAMKSRLGSASPAAASRRVD